MFRGLIEKQEEVHEIHLFKRVYSYCVNQVAEKVQNLQYL